MTPHGTYRTLHHGTTKQRADAIVANGPDEFYVEFGGIEYAEGFSTADAAWPVSYLNLGVPANIARDKALGFPSEGGAVILEVQVPEEFIDLVRADWDGNFNYLSGDIRFEPGCGLEELKREWDSLIKRVIVL